MLVVKKKNLIPSPYSHMTTWRSSVKFSFGASWPHTPKPNPAMSKEESKKEKKSKRKSLATSEGESSAMQVDEPVIAEGEGDSSILKKEKKDKKEKKKKDKEAVDADVTMNDADDANQKEKPEIPAEAISPIAREYQEGEGEGETHRQRKWVREMESVGNEGFV